MDLGHFGLPNLLRIYRQWTDAMGARSRVESQPMGEDK